MTAASSATGSARVSSSSRARFEAKARSDRARRMRPFLAGVGVLVALLAAGWLLLASGLFDLEKVRVSGTERVRPETVQSAAGVTVGQPLVRIDPEAVRRRVAALPAIASVTVSRAWPSGLHITVTERVAVLAMPVAGGVRLVDADGVDFGWSRTAPRALPQLRVPADARTSTRLAALNVLLSLPDEVRLRVAAVSAESAEQVSLTLRGGAQVVWGAVDDSERKAEVLMALLERPASRYDVSAVETVSVAAPAPAAPAPAAAH